MASYPYARRRKQTVSVSPLQPSDHPRRQPASDPLGEASDLDPMYLRVLGRGPRTDHLLADAVRGRG